MAALFIALEHDEQHQRALRRERIFRDRSNPLDTFSDEEIINKYRLSRECIINLCETLNDELEWPTRRNYALPAHLQVLTALRFYASGSFQAVVGDTIGIHKSTVSRCINRVSKVLCTKIKDYIRFPQNEEERNHIKQCFHDYGQFPNTIGAIDGTLIPIKKPSEDEHLYVSRKGFHAINVQAIAAPSRKFLSVVAQYPGGTHDSYIWQNCAIARKFEDREIGRGWLLGDSGYALRYFKCLESIFIKHNVLLF